MAATIHIATLQALEGIVKATEPYHQNDTAGRDWLQKALDAIAEAKRPRNLEEDGYYRAALQQQNDELEVDDDAVVSAGEDGAFVQAWIFIPKSKIEEDDDGTDK